MLPAEPLVTIVTPSFNHSRFIRETIESVLDQDYPNIEHIVIDGGSTDGTLEILREFDDRLLWSSEPDRGPADAVNKGWARARGAILNWVNSDDVLLPGAVSAAVDALVRNPDAIGAYGPGLVLDAEGRVLADWPVPRLHARDMLSINNPLLQPAVFITADVARRAGPLDLSLSWSFDWDLFFRVAQLGPMVRVDRPLAAWRRHDDARTERGGLKRLAEVYRLLRRYGVPFTAPAYRLHILYGLRIKLSQLDRHGPALVRCATKPLNRTVEQGLRGMLWHEQHPDGSYVDGWARPRTRWHPDACGSTLHIDGVLDTALYRPLVGQQLSVAIDGKPVAGPQVLPDGPFELTLELPHEVDPETEIEIRATKSFVPRRIGLGDDRRRLAFVLRSLRVT